jgi:predicted DNA-binding antitoxin AbrB/MazE fold protein
MAITVEAVYEDGVLKLSEPLPFQEHEKVRVTVSIPSNWVQETRGILDWTGSLEDLRRLAEDPEFDPQQGP